ncbi:MAG: hypothetical protein LBC42_00900 [Puniceicoccales bacterium]|jgi:hypothetical protein|nr:hypothetical protein [Puniceicoccales bacterium]
MNNSNQYSGNPGQPPPPHRRTLPLKPVDPAMYAFNFGLTKITTIRATKKQTNLPQTTNLDPSVGKMEQRLKAIIDLQTFESILMEVLQPEVKNRSLLVPTHFRSRLAQLRESLATDKRRKKLLLGTADAVNALLVRLESQLEEETGRNELLEQYRLMILLG